MDAKELRTKTRAELDKLLLERSREQFNLRMQKGTGQLTRSSDLRRARRDIARIYTIINEQSSGDVS